MNKEFYEYIFQKHQKTEAVPSNKEIAGWALGLIRILYPEQSKSFFYSIHDIEVEVKALEIKLKEIMDSTRACAECNNEQTARAFFNQVPELYRILNTDISSILSGDPAAKTEFEIIRAYPGFYAISFYRIAHALLKLDVPLLPRILTEFAHSKTGIDIHPGATIGEYLYIDHGTGIVIGETSEIGCHVKLYQGVTLGALSVEKTMASKKRHPTVKDHVVIYSGATILGGDTIIGENSIIGGNVWLTKSVPPGSVVYHETQFKVVERKL
ncbi:Serine acetyltransferase [Arcticibacter svalbardensis MN12-7]|uniref:Serine acetyltransferase n=1 Tax=Arcticibacter svalbardensis MN12-7 TaxID=1150600 RepID=R9GNY7_9SPHI|nr:serine O-acetyltransferase EpsC [Arcticibacter svalbardensis]EOR93438.1 Serine acetyltransferase [Arcticibacter svalbardensis MN12-7]